MVKHIILWKLMPDLTAEIEKAEAQLKHLEGFLMGVRKKLTTYLKDNGYERR